MNFITIEQKLIKYLIKKINYYLQFTIKIKVFDYEGNHVMFGLLQLALKVIAQVLNCFSFCLAVRERMLKKICTAITIKVTFR